MKNTEVVTQSELHKLAREARTGLGLTQQQAADRLDVSKPSISRAETRPGGRYLKLQRRIIEELAGWELEGPLWRVNRTTNS